jgi:TonB family protein
LASPIPRELTPALAASADSRPRGPTSRTHTGWAASASLLLHVALLLLFIVAANQARKLAEPIPPIPVEVIFQGGSKTPPSVPNKEPPSPSKSRSPAPQPVHGLLRPTAPPTPIMRPQPVAPPLALPQPVPAPPTTAKPTPPNPTEQPKPQEQPNPPQLRAPPTPPKPQAQPAPSLPQPPATLVPRMELAPAPALPSKAPEVAPPPPALALPLPPPPVPVPPAPPPGAKAAPHNPFAFPAPTNFSLNGPAPAATPSERHEVRRPGMVDLSFAPKSGGANSLEIHAEADGKDVGPDWLNLVSAWWSQHGYYPDEAARLGQDGDVTVSMKVAHNGHVESLGLTDRSDSPWLNLGALSIFRNANLPPLPPDVKSDDIDLTFKIHYILVR